MTQLEILIAFGIVILIILIPFAVAERKYRKEIKELYDEYIKESEKLDKLYEKYKNEDI